MTSTIRLRHIAASTSTSSELRKDDVAVNSSESETTTTLKVDVITVVSLFYHYCIRPLYSSYISYCLFYLFWFVAGILVLRKTESAITAVRYVKRYGDSVSVRLIEDSVEFENLIRVLDKFDKPPAFLLLNQVTF